MRYADSTIRYNATAIRMRVYRDRVSSWLVDVPLNNRPCSVLDDQTCVELRVSYQGRRLRIAA